MMEYKILKIHENIHLIYEAASWFSDKWNICKNAYLESMNDSINHVIPRWYVIYDNDKIIAGAGVIENDFHPRTDLAPNVCAVYVEEAYRRQGIAKDLLEYIVNDMKDEGINQLYLATNHVGFYERYGWVYLCDVKCDGEDYFSRIYTYL